MSVHAIGKSNAMEVSLRSSRQSIARTVRIHDGANQWVLVAAQWFLGKTFESFAPIGPSIVRGRDVDPNALGVRCVLNGEVVRNTDSDRLIEVS